MSTPIAVIDEARWQEIERIVLESGAHGSPKQGFCVMEAVAYVASEPFSDHPQCACPVIASFLRSWNDNLSDEDRSRLLKPLVPRLLNTRSTLEVEDRRAWLAFDWLVREFAPSWLVLVHDLHPHAARLRALPEVRDLATARGAGAEAHVAADAASAAESAAGSAAESAARSAARSAAWSAAESAAESAARSAVDASAYRLQDSAVELVKRMCAAK